MYKRQDLVLGNDITTPVAIREMEKLKKQEVFDRDKIALVMDHFIPNKDIKSAENCKCVREFACRQDITNYFDVGEMGIEHALLPEKGLTVAGDCIIGADSHTCTYGALGAFSTGVGSTDMAAGMATGKAWFKVPSAIKFNLMGKPSKWVSGKDVILHIIGLKMCIRDRSAPAKSPISVSATPQPRSLWGWSDTITFSRYFRFSHMYSIWLAYTWGMECSTVTGRLMIALLSAVGFNTSSTALQTSSAYSGSVPVKLSGLYSKR